MWLSIWDFLQKAKTYKIGDYIFQEPSIAKTRELQDFYKKAYENNINEFEFYYGFLSNLLIKWDKEKLKDEMFEMPQSQGVKFFFYILSELGINFTNPPTEKVKE